MKRISRSLLSLCLAFVLCAALLPNTNVAKAANEGPFMITGYDVSSSSVAMGDEVTVTLYLYRTDGKTIRSRSFAASTAFRVTVPIIRRLRRRVKMAQHILLTSTT